ncbi:MAG: FtsQ-type POTRA domain-containing protein [Rhizobiales bacterium]|nr:FtsQ-type POTRA domain-containing protein [Hyphomicrobiales bacterium]
MAKRRKQRAGAGSGWRFALRRPARLFMVAAASIAVLAAGYELTTGAGSKIVSDSLSELKGATANLLGLTVQDVTVSGRQYTTAHEILDAIDVGRGDPITKVDPVAARQRVMALDWVRSASVMRLYPDTIHVSIEEHEPLAIWRNGEKTSLIDERGAVVSDLSVRSFPHLPMVVGSGAGEAAEAFLAELERRPAIAERVHASLRIGERRWSLRLDNGVIVHLPEDGIGRALDELVGINETEGLIDRDVAVVDMRLPDRVTVLPGREGQKDGVSKAATDVRGANT